MEKVIKLSTRRGNIVYDIRQALSDGLTAGELISILEEYPSDAKVVFDNDGGYSYEGVTVKSVKYGLVESYEEEMEREKAEEMMEEIENAISFIKDVVSLKGGEHILDNSGVELDTYSDAQNCNLVVYSLTTKPDFKLYGDTNWGKINLEEKITDIEDWYILYDIIRDLLL